MDEKQLTAQQIEGVTKTIREALSNSTTCTITYGMGEPTNVDGWATYPEYPTSMTVRIDFATPK